MRKMDNIVRIIERIKIEGDGRLVGIKGGKKVERGVGGDEGMEE
ncbi:hypothetical protein [Staphylococcus epidermidis]|nr:hypothetical protein [Staphylococcus epidermidis]